MLRYQEVFVDYVNIGPPTATTETDDFRLTQGGIHWFSGGGADVEYRITGTEAVSGGNTAIAASAATVDGFVTTRDFARDDATTQTNPCTDVPNTVKWTAIDGAGGALAAALVCRNFATKEIGDFDIVIDQAETWSTSGAASALDVQNAITHEFGHVAGLSHVNPPKDGCLTMFPFAAFGETQKRTLGLGDKLGLHVLYGSPDVAAGSCGS